MSTTYVNSYLHLWWECSEGHQWSASFKSVRQGRWCPHCAGNARRSLEDAQGLALRRGGMCLSTTYVNNHADLVWRCRDGHEWNANFRSVQAGTWCPYCARNRRLSLKDVQDLAIKKGGILLSKEYINVRQHLKWRCRQGHEWLASVNGVKHGGTWCPRCAVESRRLSLKDAQDTALAKGGTVLSTEYFNCRTHLKWRCREGHQWLATLNTVKNSGTWCPECAAGVSEREVRTILEQKIFPGKSFRKSRPEFLSTGRGGGRLELDGYCKELSIAFEYQGEQHYDPDSYFHKGRGGSFQDLMARDKLKAYLCKVVGVHLLIVPYYEKDPEALLRRLLGLSQDRGKVDEQPLRLERMQIVVATGPRGWMHE